MYCYILRLLVFEQRQENGDTETQVVRLLGPLRNECRSGRRQIIEIMQRWTTKGDKIVREELFWGIINAKFIKNRLECR